MKFALYRQDTGQVTSTVVLPSAAFLPPPPQGYAFIEAGAAVFDDTHRVDNGQIVAMPPRPSRRHEYDFIARAWVVAAESDDVLAARARKLRDAELQASDKTQLPDFPIAADVRAQWAAYRDQLRNITEQPGFPTTINWPSRPSEL